MPAMPVPVAGERESLLEYLRYQHSAFLAVSRGLTDEQARLSPTVSTLCIGGLIKHVTTMEYAWTQQVISEDPLPDDPRSLTGMMADHADQYRVHDDESLEGLLATFREQNAETLHVFGEADLDAPIVVPAHIQMIYEDPHWTTRWVLLHIIEEMARHAGHADVIRETIDGSTMYQLLADLEGWAAAARARAAQA
jgi:uncharacterized damage-inducible protein DinB